MPYFTEIRHVQRRYAPEYIHVSDLLIRADRSLRIFAVTGSKWKNSCNGLRRLAQVINQSCCGSGAAAAFWLYARHAHWLVDNVRKIAHISFWLIIKIVPLSYNTSVLYVLQARYWRVPHFVVEIWRHLAPTSIMAEYPSGKLPTTLVRRRISLMILSRPFETEIFGFAVC